MRSTNGIRHRGRSHPQKGDRERQAGSNDPAHAQDPPGRRHRPARGRRALATAQSGAADDPEASVRTFNGANDVTQVCQTRSGSECPARSARGGTTSTAAP